MSGQLPTNKIGFGEAVLYRIAVQGSMSADTGGRLGGMEVVPGDSTIPSGVTVLEGRLQDQAELSGVLNTLHDLHMAILEVKALESEL